MPRTKNTREVIITSDSSGESWSAAVWDPRTGSLLQTYKNAAALGYGTLRLLSDSYILGADVTKPRIHVWPLNSQAPVPNLRLTTPGKVTALCCAPSGSYIVAAVGEKLFIWQVCNGRLLSTLARHYQTVSCLTFNMDGSLFASGAEDGLVFVWSLFQAVNDERPGPLYGFSDHSLPVKDLHFSHFGARGRLCSVSLDRTANIYEANTGKLLMTLVFNVPLTSVCMNIRESEIFLGCTDGNILRFYLYEPPRGIEHHVRVSANDNAESDIFRGHKASVSRLSVSVDCRTLLSGSTDGSVNIWDIPGRQILRTIEHKGPITAAFFAKHFENFHAATFNPNIVIRNFQRSSDEADKDTFVEVISREPDTKFLSSESFEDSVRVCSPNNENKRKLDEAKEEIQKLKKINAAMYRYSVECILGKHPDNR